MARRTIRGSRPTRDVKTEEEFRNFWNRNYSGDMSGELADMFTALYGEGSYSGGVGGIDRSTHGGVTNEYGEFSGPGFNQDSPFGNDWLGRDSRVYDQFGDPIRFRRDVSPYMMYNYAEMPEMWDELPHPATPSRGEAGMRNEFMVDPYREAYGAEARGDVLEDLLNIAREDRRRTGASGIGSVLNNMNRGNDFINRMRRRGGLGG